MSNIETTDTINGFPIIQATEMQPAQKYRRAGRVILVDRGAEEPSLRYVVACQYAKGGVLDRGWSQGDYIADYCDAVDAYLARKI
jgi:hypothetical protein